MAITDSNGLPISASIASASPHEVKLVEQAIKESFVEETPARIIGDRAYDSDPLDKEMRDKYGIEIVAPHKENRKKAPTQDGRVLRRYIRRWKVERFFAWLHNYRRIVVRWDFKSENFLGLLQMACLTILMRKYL